MSSIHLLFLRLGGAVLLVETSVELLIVVGILVLVVVVSLVVSSVVVAVVGESVIGLGLEVLFAAKLLWVKTEVENPTETSELLFLKELTTSDESDEISETKDNIDAEEGGITFIIKGESASTKLVLLLKSVCDTLGNSMVVSGVEVTFVKFESKSELKIELFSWAGGKTVFVKTIDGFNVILTK